MLSWVDFSVDKVIKPMSLYLENGDFLFLAGETEHGILLRALAGFMPKESNCTKAARVKGKSLNGEKLPAVLLPKNAVEALPKHRTIREFALDISNNRTKQTLEKYAVECGIDIDFLNCKPAELDLHDLQKITLWLTSLYKTVAIFVEEPECGFCHSVRPLDFLQNMLKIGTTSCVVYFTPQKENILAKAKNLQFCNAKVAVFCADMLVEYGDASSVLCNPQHAYTKEYLKSGVAMRKKNGSLWNYCAADCDNSPNCPKRIADPPTMQDCNDTNTGEHRVICLRAV